jgi:hypothetical protein
MANGDAVVRDIVVAKYVTDDNHTYQRKQPSFYQAQGSLGWVLTGNTWYPQAPKGLKPRRWLVWNAADHTQRASVNIGTNAAYVAGVPLTTTVKMAYRGYELTMTVYGMEGERIRGRAGDQGVQAELPA